MHLVVKHRLFTILLYTIAALGAGLANHYADTVSFKFFKNNKMVFESRSALDNLALICDPAEPWLIIVPGWLDDCSARTEWVPPLIEKFAKYRGGCICCMDYFAWSNDPSLVGYVNLTSNFDGLSTVLTTRLEQFERQHFAPQRGYMFSMSFGSRLAIDAGISFGGKLAGLDACDPAGPLFYPNPEHQRRGAVRSAARNVQVIHTSVDEGTFERDAHQDWCMGDCGVNQAAAPLNDPAFAMYGMAEYSDAQSGLYVPYSRKNHNMCPLFYLSAFEHRFEAMRNPCCAPSKRDACPKDYRMGYMQPNKGRVQLKTLYAMTYKKAPYNKPD